MRQFLSTGLILLALSSPSAWAHGGRPHSPAELARAWSFEPGVIIPLALSGWLYGRGLSRLWRGGKTRLGVQASEALCYAGGWLALLVALVSPLHPWGRVLFSAHMTQHEVLMLGAAPLLVLGKPLLPFLKALPKPWAVCLGRYGNSPGWQSLWGELTRPFTAWLVHAMVLWAWHIPRLFNATIDNEWVHAFQHLSFLGSALLFWWAVLHGRERRMGYGMAVLYLFTTALHSGLLGALLTFALRVWYPVYAGTAGWWGLTPLEDQQLGGLIMWVPAGLVYVVAGLILFAKWLHEAEVRAAARDLVRVASHLSLLAIAFTMLSGCDPSQANDSAPVPTGDPHRGRLAINRHGCATCHTIPGIAGADGLVGPPLTRMGARVYIAGVLRNTPDNMLRWLENPPGVDPLTAMPNLHLEDAEARDIASYLYTLK